MAQSSDEIIKRELIDHLGSATGDLSLRVFPESSNDDQKQFSDGGLTFGFNGLLYGSCDACWVRKKDWLDPYNKVTSSEEPVIALEGTDALNRGSSGNAQYQRFHHALGAVKAGIIGVYYLKKGADKIQEDLYEMAYNASQIESGTYLIIDDLSELKTLLDLIDDNVKTKAFIEKKLSVMHSIFQKKFDEKYGSWEEFAKKRSTIIKDTYVIKYSGRMLRNFTDSSQRAGHIAVGEMYLTKYFFPRKHVYYLWPKMSSADIEYLDSNKSVDKEWQLLRNEPGVEIITRDDLVGVPSAVITQLYQIRDEPLKGEVLVKFNNCMQIISDGLRNGKITIKTK